MTGLFWGELLGTLFLILLGDGVVAGVLLNKSKAQNAGWIVITTGWCFAVMVGVFVALGLWRSRRLAEPRRRDLGDPAIAQSRLDRMITGIGAEFIGAFIGAVLVYLHYLPHWAETDDKGLKLRRLLDRPGHPQYRQPTCISEIIGTFVLVVGVGAIFSSGVLKAVFSTAPSSLARASGPSWWARWSGASA